MFDSFFRRPTGVGSSLNIYMFAPRGLWHALKVLFVEPRYFVSRIGVLIYQLFHPRDPWLTSETIAFLDAYLSRDMRGFEWGSGRSTLWLAKRLGTLVSVEDNAQWYEHVRRELAGLDVDYRYVPNGGRAYAEQIVEFSDASFDFVLVDGSARDECIAAAAGKVRPGGVIVVDNADLDIDVTPLATFDCRSTSNGVWRTHIYTRRGGACQNQRA